MFDIVKLGGSLLSDAGWPRRFESWLASRSRRRVLLIVGGGEMIEAMRQLDAVHSLDAATMHWRCVRMLGHTADVAAELLGRDTAVTLTRLTTLQEIAALVCCWQKPDDAGGPSQVAIADVDAFYRPDIASPRELPSDPSAEDRNPSGLVATPTVGWQTTTDAIAVFAAAQFGASECVLLKSCRVDQFRDLDDAAAAGVIDPEAARIAVDGRKVSLVQL